MYPEALENNTVISALTHCARCGEAKQLVHVLVNTWGQVVVIEYTSKRKIDSVADVPLAAA